VWKHISFHHIILSSKHKNDTLFAKPKILRNMQAKMAYCTNYNINLEENNMQNFYRQYEK